MCDITKKMCQHSSASFHSFFSHCLVKHCIRETTSFHSFFHNQAILYSHSSQSKGEMLKCSSTKWILISLFFDSWNKNSKQFPPQEHKKFNFPVWDLSTHCSSTKLVYPSMEEKNSSMLSTEEFPVFTIV